MVINIMPRSLELFDEHKNSVEETLSTPLSKEYGM